MCGQQSKKRTLRKMGRLQLVTIKGIKWRQTNGLGWSEPAADRVLWAGETVASDPSLSIQDPPTIASACTHRQMIAWGLIQLATCLSTAHGKIIPIERIINEHHDLVTVNVAVNVVSHDLYWGARPPVLSTSEESTSAAQTQAQCRKTQKEASDEGQPWHAEYGLIFI